jgi:hypothetical protein
MHHRGRYNLHRRANWLVDNICSDISSDLQLIGEYHGAHAVDRIAARIIMDVVNALAHARGDGHVLRLFEEDTDRQGLRAPGDHATMRRMFS